jgi:hypothetical protein
MRAFGTVRNGWRDAFVSGGLALHTYRHLTPRYLIDRVRLIAYERRHPDAPWLTSEAIAFLEPRLVCAAGFGN